MKPKQLTYFLICVVGTAVFLTVCILLFTCTCMWRYQKANRQLPIFRQFFQQVSGTMDAMDNFLVNEEFGDYQQAVQSLTTANTLLLSMEQEINEPRIIRELLDLEAITHAMSQEMEMVALAMEDYHQLEESRKVDGAKKVSARYQNVVLIYSAVQDEYEPLTAMLLDYLELLYQRLNQKSFLALALVLLVSAVSGIMLYLQIYHIHYAFSSPVNQLLKAARLVAEENYDQAEIKLEDTGNDEGMGLFIQVFNQMIAQIKQRMETLKENARVQRLLQESRFKELQMQINPHFMFNTMNMIADYAYLEHAENTVLLLNHTAKMFRFSLDFSGKTVTLDKELAELEHYLFIQRKRFGERIQFIENYPAALPSLNLPALTLQPLVENAVTHGTGMRRTGAEISIAVFDNREEGFCEITVSDNGHGMSPETLEKVRQDMISHYRRDEKEKSGKIGLGNVYLRLKLLWGDKASLQLSSEEGKGTKVSLIIAYREELPSCTDY